jgi:hypothetical protein
MAGYKAYLLKEKAIRASEHSGLFIVLELTI